MHIDNISVRFESFSLNKVGFELQQNDYLALLGVSGAGKTVLLEVLAGLVKPLEGKIFVNGKDITGMKIQQRSIGLVYQDLSLFPHMTVQSNIAYGLKARGGARKEIHARVMTLARETEVSHLLNRYPETLSGGEGQRVALARTLAADPDILLLDEPLSKLDVKLKAGLRNLLRRIHASGKSIIHVTHDYMEVATLANKVAVIEAGRLIQFGTPASVFRNPVSEFVARFGGAKNLFPCVVKSAGNHSGLLEAQVGNDLKLKLLGEGEQRSGYVLIPQEDIILSQQPLDSSAVNRILGEVKEVYESGSGIEVVVDAGRDFVVSLSRPSREKLGLEPGKKLWLHFKASAVRFLEG